MSTSILKKLRKIMVIPSTEHVSNNSNMGKPTKSNTHNTELGRPGKRNSDKENYARYDHTKIDNRAPNNNLEYIESISELVNQKLIVDVHPPTLSNSTTSSENDDIMSKTRTMSTHSDAPIKDKMTTNLEKITDINITTTRTTNNNNTNSQTKKKLKSNIKSSKLSKEQRDKMINFDFKYNKAKRIVYKQVYYGHPINVNQPNNDITTNDSNNNNMENNNEDGKNKRVEPIQISFPTTEVIGHGSFGVVFTTTLKETNELVAIKKVLQDRRFKNRELEIMKLLKHPNIIDLKFFFYEKDDQNEVYLNLILDYMPQSLYQRLRHFVHQRTSMPRLEIKFYMYQLFKSLNYLHNYSKVCHRDIKPQNLLVDPNSWCLKLCDFGSAKQLKPTEPNVSYICSRYYRAPELIFGATNYTNQIDIWSSGCVMAELLLGQPMFPGESGIDQLVEIIKILGTPSKQEICSMNPNYMEHKFPQIKPIPLSKVFKKEDELTIDFISNVLKYNPLERFTSLQCLCSPYFDELRVSDGGKIKEMINDLELFEFDMNTELNYLTEDELNAVKPKLKFQM